MHFSRRIASPSRPTFGVNTLCHSTLDHGRTNGNELKHSNTYPFTMEGYVSLLVVFPMAWPGTNHSVSGLDVY